MDEIIKTYEDSKQVKWQRVVGGSEGGKGEEIS